MHKCKTKDCERQIEDDVIYCSIECYLYDGGKMNEPIQIREIKETECQLLNPDNAVIGIIRSELQLNDVRLQINRKKLKGYKLLWVTPNDDSISGWNRKVKMIWINEYGRLDDWSNGFFDISDKQMNELIGI